VEPVKVPQHLELDDQVAWGLTGTDLLCLVAGVAVGWWLYLRVPGPLALQLIIAAPPALIGITLAFVRLGERTLRAWIAVGVTYLARPRVLTT
jgi:ABC-type sulfate transport system permease component